MSYIATITVELCDVDDEAIAREHAENLAAMVDDYPDADLGRIATNVQPTPREGFGSNV